MSVIVKAIDGTELMLVLLLEVFSRRYMRATLVVLKQQRPRRVRFSCLLRRRDPGECSMTKGEVYLDDRECVATPETSEGGSERVGGASLKGEVLPRLVGLGTPAIDG